jgi:biopolymer transport protein ExbB
MLYDLIGRLAGIGGEFALALLFLISTVSLAIVCDRVWYFAQRLLNIDLFAQRLGPSLKSGDWSSAQQTAQESPASPAVVVAAGLSQYERGSVAMQAVMRATTARERMRMEAYLDALRVLGFTALLVGTCGTVFDLWEYLNSPGVSSAGRTVISYQGIAVLAPLAAGLMAATPAFIVASLLQSHVRKLLHQIEFITEFVMAHAIQSRGVQVDAANESPRAFSIRAA